jgi:predicted RNase H-like HicB family nuclease
MSDVKTMVHVEVDYFDGQEEGDVGHPYYVAHSPELHFTTDGTTFEEMVENVRECLQLCLHDGNSIEEFGVAPDAKVQLIMNLPGPYAKTA